MNRKGCLVTLASSPNPQLSVFIFNEPLVLVPGKQGLKIWASVLRKMKTRAEGEIVLFNVF